MEKTKRDQTLVAMFREEGRSMVDSLGEMFKRLHERGYDDSVIASAFRHAHSVKSEAAFLGFDDLASKANAVEGALNRLRRSPEDFNAESLDEATAAFVGLEAAFASGPEGPDAVEPEESLSAADVRAQPGAGAGAGAGDKKGAPTGADTVDASDYADAVPMDSGAEVEADLGSGTDEVGHVEYLSAGELPEQSTGLLKLTPFERSLVIDAVDRGETLYYLSCSITPDSSMPFARVYLVINNLEQRVNVIKIAPDTAKLQSGKVRSFECLFSTTEDEGVVYEATNVDEIAHVAVTHVSSTAVLAEAENEMTVDHDRREMSMQLSSGRYERLGLFAAELAHQLHIAAEEISDQEGAVAEKSRRRGMKILSRLAAEIDKTVRGAARVPLRALFSEIIGPAKRLAERSSVPVVFDAHSTSAFVDVQVGRILTDVLFHLIRNSLDHGIEPLEERQRAGKSNEARIRMVGGLNDGLLTITVSDDGRGIVRDRPEESDGETLDRISAAGYTTGEADSDSGRSGRGVGLDVVRHAVEEILSGTVYMENRPGSGVEFVISIPAGLRLTSVVTCKDDDRLIGFPLSLLTEKVLLNRRTTAVDQEERVFYRLGGELLPVYRVSGVVASAKELDAGALGLAIRFGGLPLVVMVTGVVGEESVVVGRRNQGFYSSRLVDGEVELVLPYAVAEEELERRG